MQRITRACLLQASC